MNITCTALRGFPLSEKGFDVRHVREGEEFVTTLTKARALRDAGKATFDDPKETKGGEGAATSAEKEDDAAKPQDDTKA